MKITVQIDESGAAKVAFVNNETSETVREALIEPGQVGSIELGSVQSVPEIAIEAAEETAGEGEQAAESGDGNGASGDGDASGEGAGDGESSTAGEGEGSGSGTAE